MTINNQASTGVIQLLEKLFKDWDAWEQNREYYINILLPDLMSHPNNGTSQEKAIVREIKKVASPEELEHIVEIADNLQKLKKINQEISALFDCFYKVNDFRAAEVFALGNPNPSVSSIFQQKKRAAVSRVMGQVRLDLNRYDFRTAEETFLIIRDFASKTELDEYNQLRNDKQKSLIENKIDRIKEACWLYRFNEVGPLYEEISNWVSWDEIEPIIQESKNKQAEEEKQRFVKKTIERIQSLLSQYNFDEAEKQYFFVKRDYSFDEYRQSVHFYIRKQDREKLTAELQTAFKNSHFQLADQIFQKTDLLTVDEYIQLKSPWIKDFVQAHYGQKINIEKAAALANPSQNLLLSARAGSGKTTVLGCKVGLLIDTENVHPDHILVMAFNTSAAGEIRNRIRLKFKQPAYENARTFHSLASQLVQPEEDILYDDKEDVSTRKMTVFIQQIMKTEIKNPVFIEKMYEFFRKEMREIERAGFTLDDDSYFDYRRNMLQVALGGEKVKSAGEKIIADYLFEHDISYKYEKVWLSGSQIYRPDFSIYDQQKDFVIEHWGIDEFDPNKSVAKEWNQTWDEYYAEMQWKRSYWQGEEEPAILIETSIRDLRGGREAFEKILEERLSKAGISRPKLSRQALIQKVKDRDYTITKLAELFTQFIQKAKKQMLKAKDVQGLLQIYQAKDEREAAFIDLACRIYMIYEKALVRNKKIDFDDLIMRAIEKVHVTRGECAIWLGSPKSRPVKMNDLRWILLDEYQDFSRLFFELIEAIRKYNSSVRLYCVGDDWQAINGFAGSDLNYFTGFSKWVQNASIATLTTNFRSQVEIVNTGNQLMRGKGMPAQALPDKPGGDVHIEWMDDTWVEMRGNEANAILKAEHERFIITEPSANGNGKKYIKVVASKYLRRCYDIILNPNNIGKSIAILSRTNWIDGVRLREFKKHLVSCFIPADLEKIKDPDKMIDVQTAHKYKGLQADLVIILNVTDGTFPLLHPDNALFDIFGKKLEDALLEEMRLFYVALTRATTSLFVLTERNRESSFLTRLDCYRSPNHLYQSPRRSSNSKRFHYDAEMIPF